MQKLEHTKYNGFTLGFRIADAFALTANVTNKKDIAALHAIKNLLNTDGLSRELKTFSVNNVFYVGGV